MPTNGVCYSSIMTSSKTQFGFYGVYLYINKKEYFNRYESWYRWNLKMQAALSMLSLLVDSNCSRFVKVTKRVTAYLVYSNDFDIFQRWLYFLVQRNFILTCFFWGNALLTNKSLIKIFNFYPKSVVGLEDTSWRIPLEHNTYGMVTVGFLCTDWNIPWWSRRFFAWITKST